MEQQPEGAHWGDCHASVGICSTHGFESAGNPEHRKIASVPSMMMQIWYKF